MREELFQEAFRKYGTPLYVFDLDILKDRQNVFVLDLVRRSTFVMQ